MGVKWAENLPFKAERDQLWNMTPTIMAFVGKVVKKQGEEGIVDLGGVRRNITLSLVDAEEGEWVLVHAGYAMIVLKEHEVEDDLKRKISSVINDGDEGS